MLGRGEAPTRRTESLPDTPFAGLPHGMPQKGVPTLIHKRVRPPGTLNPGGTFHAGITLHLGVPTLIHKRVRPPGTLHAGISPLAHSTWGFPRYTPFPHAPLAGLPHGMLHQGVPTLAHSTREISPRFGTLHLGVPTLIFKRVRPPGTLHPDGTFHAGIPPHLGDHSKREVSLSVCSTWEVSSLAHPTRNRVPLGHSMRHTPLGGLPHGMFHNGGPHPGTLHAKLRSLDPPLAHSTWSGGIPLWHTPRETVHPYHTPRKGKSSWHTPLGGFPLTLHAKVRPP